MTKKRQSATPVPRPSHSYVYDRFGLSTNLDPLSATARQMRNDLLNHKQLSRHKTLLRQRHIAKLHRNIGLVAMPCLLTGCFTTVNVGTATACAFGTIAALFYMLCSNSTAITAGIRTEPTFAALSKQTAEIDHARLNAALVRERTLRLLPVGPVRAIGALFDRCFGTPAL